MAKIAARPQSVKTRKPKVIKGEAYDGPRRPRNEAYSRASYRSMAQRGQWED